MCLAIFTGNIINFQDRIQNEAKDIRFKMFNLFRNIFFILWITLFSALGMQMGIELEQQGVTYIKPEAVVLQDHIRLFESLEKIDDRPIWYLEVDGSGNLEFVTDPIATENAECEGRILSIIQQMRSLLDWCLNQAHPGQYGFSLSIPQSQFSSHIETIGTWVHKSADGETLANDISIIIQNPTWRVRPQITFQLPLPLIPSFIVHMAYEHGSLTKTLNNMIKNEFFPLGIFGRSFSAGEGLAYLTILYAERLSNYHDSSELGPKGILTLMSRVSFSEMYSRLPPSDKDIFNSILENFLKVNGKINLFKAPYSLFYGENLAENQEIRTAVGSLKIKDFIDSIITPEKFSEFTQECRDKFHRILTELGESETIDEDAKPVIQEVLTIISKRFFNFNGKDIISPPPFLRHTYSMGKYTHLTPGTAVIEMRGYNQKNSQLRMDETIVDWLKEEIQSTLINWEISKSLKRMIKGNIEGCLNLINKCQNSEISLEKLIRELHSPLIKTLSQRIMQAIHALRSIDELSRLKQEYIEFLKNL